MIIIISIILNSILSYFISESGSSREIGAKKSFWISALFGFLIGVLITMSSRALDKEERNESSKEPENISLDVGIYFLILSLILVFYVASSNSSSAEYQARSFVPYEPDSEWEEYKKIQDSIHLANIKSMENPYKWSIKNSKF